MARHANHVRSVYTSVSWTSGNRVPSPTPECMLARAFHAFGTLGSSERRQVHLTKHVYTRSECIPRYSRPTQKTPVSSCFLHLLNTGNVALSSSSSSRNACIHASNVFLWHTQEWTPLKLYITRCCVGSCAVLGNAFHETLVHTFRMHFCDMPNNVSR